MGDTYSVRVAASIAKRGEGATRRRAGLTFGAEETLVSTDREREGATHVTEKQLREILDDSNLRGGDALYPEPGLRVKEAVQAAAQEGAGGGKEEKPVERRPGRPRKAAKE